MVYSYPTIKENDLYRCRSKYTIYILFLYKSFCSNNLHPTVCGIAITNMTNSIEEENDSDYFDDENSGLEKKRKRCSFCERSKDKKTPAQCSACSAFVCDEHSVKRIFYNNCCE